MANGNSDPDTFIIVVTAICALICVFGVVYLIGLADREYDRKYNTPIGVVIKEDLGIDIDTYTLSTQTIILQKGATKLGYVYSGKYNDEYIIQGIKQGSYEQTFYPIYVNVGDTLTFSWFNSYSQYANSRTTRRYVSFKESWMYQITEITTQQVTLERFKLISREWK